MTGRAVGSVLGVGTVRPGGDFHLLERVPYGQYASGLVTGLNSAYSVARVKRRQSMLVSSLVLR